MKNNSLPLNAKCKTCKKSLGDHQTDPKTKKAMCPTGSKSRIGWITFSDTDSFVLGKLPKQGFKI